MYSATLLLLAICHVLTQVIGQSGGGGSGANNAQVSTTLAPLNIDAWTPTCSGSTIIIPTGATAFNGYQAEIVSPPNGCSLKDFDLAAGTTIPKACIDMTTTMSVTLKIKPKKNKDKYDGGRDYKIAKITCSLGKDGVNATVSVDFKPTTASPQLFTPKPQAPALTMDLVVKTAGADISAATSVSTTSPKTVALGQDNVYLKITDPVANQLLLPTKCSGVSSGPSKSTYVFFSTSNGTTCAYDDEVLGKFNLDAAKQVSYAQFYPFMFVSGESITLTCEVLVCPESPSGGKCQDTKGRVENCNAGGSVVQSKRRRRSAREGEPDTHVVEVTYTVVGHDPALDGQTAAGAVMAVSIPLLAAVASLWIL